jgi:hypothetical protein
VIGATIGQILANAVGVAISPIPIIAVILMLLSRHPAANGLAFLAGWMLALVVLCVVVLAIGFAGDSGQPSTAGSVVKILIGAAFLLLGVKQWRGRPRGDTEPTMPGWMSAVEGFNAVKSFGIGLALAGVNPKNLGLTVAAAASISAAHLSQGGNVVVVLVYVVLASVSIGVPVVAVLVMGDRATPVLTATRTWLAANGPVIMTVLFLVLGAKVLGEGLAVFA